MHSDDSLEHLETTFGDLDKMAWSQQHLKCKTEKYVFLRIWFAYPVRQLTCRQLVWCKNHWITSHNLIHCSWCTRKEMELWSIFDNHPECPTHDLNSRCWKERIRIESIPSKDMRCECLPFYVSYSTGCNQSVNACPASPQTRSNLHIIAAGIFGVGWDWEADSSSSTILGLSRNTCKTCVQEEKQQQLFSREKGSTATTL